MTEAEEELLRLTAELWNKFILLPQQHPMDKEEFCHKIHDLQRFILSRPVERHLTTSKV